MWILKTDKTKAVKYAVLFNKCNPRYFQKKSEKRNYIPKNLKTTYVYKNINKTKFIEYLTANPNELIKLHDDLIPNILDKSTGKIKEDEKKALDFIFDYNNVISENTDLSYQLAEIMGVNTCVYCNRQYTLTVTKRSNDIDKHIIRPQFDHWYPQSLYPDLRLSYFNLIPSCALCNSVLKKEREFKKDDYIHPYIDKSEGFKFGFYSIGTDVSGREHYRVVCDIQDITRKTKIKNTLDIFKIEDIYSAHESLELKDLIELAKANPGDYIRSLIDNVMEDTGFTEEQVKRYIFSIESSPDEFLKRPLSKFKTEIMEVLEKMYLK